jgi:Cu(I)/Ag(I) efflux system membrane fusion protein
MNRKIKRLLVLGAIFVAGIILGRLPWGGAARDRDHGTEQAAGVWTCSMHPQIRMNDQGKCPICAMDLILLKSSCPDSGKSALDPDAIRLSEEAAALADVQTTVVSRADPVVELQLYGVVKPDERRLRSQVAHIGGRIERLAAGAAGETIRAGQTIATIYSPELLSAQQELLEALASGDARLLDAAREKLRGRRMTDSQIEAVERSGVVSPTVEIAADAGGVVTARRAEQGDYVAQGGALFDMAELSSVWIVLDAYQADLSSLAAGGRVEYTLAALPGKTFSGRIAFIDPVLDRATRTAKIRVEAPNPRMELKPGMYVDASVRVPLRGNGRQIVVPRSAVLWTGKRSAVYVRLGDGQPTFKMREVELGASLGEAYIVLSGLDDGERVVTSGAFAIDASAQLEGRPSMMNRAAATPEAATPKTVAPTGREQGQDHAMLTVQGLCDMCRERIEKAAQRIAGVSSAVWDRNTKRLDFDFDPAGASPDAVARAVAAAGHDNDRHRADDKAYDALPPCCKYRK